MSCGDLKLNNLIQTLRPRRPFIGNGYSLRMLRAIEEPDQSLSIGECVPNKPIYKLTNAKDKLKFILFKLKSN